LLRKMPEKPRSEVKTIKVPAIVETAVSCSQCAQLTYQLGAVTDAQNVGAEEDVDPNKDGADKAGHAVEEEHAVGAKEDPLEAVPAELGLVLGLETALADLEDDALVVVDEAGLAHARGAGSERVTATALLGAAVGVLAGRVELGELGGDIVDGQRKRCGTAVLVSRAQLGEIGVRHATARAAVAVLAARHLREGEVGGHEQVILVLDLLHGARVVVGAGKVVVGRARGRGTLVGVVRVLVGAAVAFAVVASRAGAGG
jgi:hypothetical protein